MPQATSNTEGGWTRVCALDDISPCMGVCALLGGRQVAEGRARLATAADRL